MKRLLSKQPSKASDTPYSPVSLKFSNRKSGISLHSAESLSLKSDQADYPLGNKKVQSPNHKSPRNAPRRVKSPNRGQMPQSTTMYSMLSTSSLDLQKLSPKFSKKKEENAVAAKLKKAAHNFVEDDDIDSLLKLIEDYKSTSPEVKEVIEKENWTLESRNKELLELFMTKLIHAFPRIESTFQAIVGLNQYIEKGSYDKVSEFINLKVVVKIIEGKRRLSPVHLAVINGL
ncbi:hypothetical protein HELRODRAFT_167129 [Helobdella robusta]|uniref:Uncharacterized protein n=1 Tax=Helobdella robusta TaxID=6412 RepID=T1EZ22_HELRO|nr:hypothetical protein HELRODRAFT_167129 [Helobdella robusta]ESO10622.1 hypothetical protein HELRODRAFT_167129 [Helobdella robusta]